MEAIFAEDAAAEGSSPDRRTSNDRRWSALAHDFLRLRALLIVSHRSAPCRKASRCNARSADANACNDSVGVTTVWVCECATLHRSRCCVRCVVRWRHTSHDAVL